MFKAARPLSPSRYLVIALVFCTSAQPTLNAPDVKDSRSSLATRLFEQARRLELSLHERPHDQLDHSDYLPVLDAYGQVVRLNTDNHFAGEALIRIAELRREMADAAGDSALYHDAIATYKQIVQYQTNSVFVGNAIVGIAQVYEDSLQDLAGAASAYRELINHFPSSVLAREARAILSRFEAELRDRPEDVLTPSHAPRSDAERGQVTNVRNFSGFEYGRVVVDLGGPVRATDTRVLGDRLIVRLSDAGIAPGLFGRRFIIRDRSLIRRIVLSEADGTNSGVQLEIVLGERAVHSLSTLKDPDRIVIDLFSGSAAERFRSLSYVAGSDVGGENHSGRPSSFRHSGATLSLPEITDPILPLSPADWQTGKSPLAIEDGAISPVRCIVIDPGHGGHDAGTISRNGLREKDLVLDVARRLRAYIKRAYPDVEVILTRDGDRYVSLEERTAIANSRRADLFISIHANASHSRIASGVETFFVSPDRARTVTQAGTSAEEMEEVSESAGQNDERESAVVASVSVGNRVTESRELARYIQAGLVRGIGAESPRTAANRGVKHAPFSVLAGAHMPSVLAEISFLSNPRDEALLMTSPFRERVAASLFAGLNTYLRKSRQTEPRTMQ